MSQFDMFSDALVVAPAPRPIPLAPTYPSAVEIELRPLALRVRVRNRFYGLQRKPMPEVRRMEPA
jgi:hypothetical protein